MNPGVDSLIQLSSGSDSLLLSGSATVPKGKIVSYLWSQISGPNTALITNPGSATTYVTNIVAGTYVFQLMAIDNYGATGVKAVSITLTAPKIYTTTLRLDNSTYDLHLQGNAYKNYSDPNSTEIGAATWTVDGELFFLRGLLKFDLAKIPASARPVSAKLMLYSIPKPINGDKVHANAGNNNIMLIQRVTSGWNSTISWQSQPSSDQTAQIIIPHTNQSFLDLKDIDVTDMVKKMLQTANYGFLLKLQNEVLYNSRIFCSSKYPDASKHPVLILQYSM